MSLDRFGDKAREAHSIDRERLAGRHRRRLAARSTSEPRRRISSLRDRRRSPACSLASCCRRALRSPPTRGPARDAPASCRRDAPEAMFGELPSSFAAGEPRSDHAHRCSALRFAHSRSHLVSRSDSNTTPAREPGRPGRPEAGRPTAASWRIRTDPPRRSRATSGPTMSVGGCPAADANGTERRGIAQVASKRA